MKKKEGKDKESKLKVDYNELINRNLHDFKLTYDYAGYQYTRLDLNVSYATRRTSLSTSSPPFSKSSST